MLHIRRSEERGSTKIGWLSAKHSFSFGDFYDPKFSAFRSLRVINEDVVSGGGGFHPHPHKDMEIVTYVLAGALAHKDSTGGESVLRAGEVQRMSAGSGVVHSEFNHSSTEPVHLLQIWLTPERRGITPIYEESTLDRLPGQDSWRTVASIRDGEGMKIHQDASIYVSKLKDSEKVVHSISEGRSVWIQVIEGEVSVNGVVGRAGDAVYGDGESELSFSTPSSGHFLVFDLA